MISCLLLYGCPSAAPSPAPTTSSDTGTPPESGDTGTPFVPDPDWIPIDGVTWTGDPGDTLGDEFTVGDPDGDGDAEIIATRRSPLVGPTEYRSAETQGALLIDGVPPAGPARGVARTEWVEPAVDHGSFGRLATVVGDVSGDGFPDVAMSGLDAEVMVLVFPGTTTGIFGITDAELILSKLNTDDDFEWNHAPIVPCGDVSGDGLDDLCAGDRVFWGPVGSAIDETYADVALLSSVRPEGYALHDEEPIDMDADGTAEIVLAMFSVEQIGDPPRVGRFDASVAGVRDVTQPDTTWGAADGIGALAHGDLDGDGVDDLVVSQGLGSDQSGQRTFVLTNLVGGALTDAPISLAARYGDALGTDVTVGDFDGDGQLDLATAIVSREVPSERVAVFTGPLGAGDGSEDDAAAIWLPPTSNTWVNLGAGDLDADGRDDLVIARPTDEAAGPRAGALIFLSGAGL
ncbi:MAG: VCBS repeat-containing protein [Myxococcota bacterium]